jgi:glycosyltransferase involved in cell wall biosynthesis
VAAYSQPLVSVITPVYNGEKYLAECIESVLAQTYDNWEYVIVNNCSTDLSLTIAKKYSKKYAKIRIYDNAEFLSILPNFNHAMRQISPESKYCKVVHADDLLFPECISEMVALAEENPSVGIVSSYVLQGNRVTGNGLSYPQTVFSGREICRMSLNLAYTPGWIYVFGSPSSLLIRSDIIRSRDPFYNEKYHMCCDQEVCYYILQYCDFGFIHQVLTYSRLHDQSMTSEINSHNLEIIEMILLMKDYGPIYFSKQEHEERLEQALDLYYKFLSNSFLKRKNKEFLQFHKKGFKKLNIRPDRYKLIAGVLEAFSHKVIHSLLHPHVTIQKLISR